MENLLQDLRYALRMLRKSPAFTLVALLTLMLGVGANVVVFGVVNATLLRPLPVSDPRSLYQIRLKPWAVFKAITTSYPAFEDFRRRNTTWSGLAGFNGYSGGRLRWGNAVKSVSGQSVTGNYFDLLGIEPQFGRLIQAADERGANSAPDMVLSDRLWRTAFNADPGVVGPPSGSARILSPSSAWHRRGSTARNGSSGRTTGYRSSTTSTRRISKIGRAGL